MSDIDKMRPSSLKQAISINAINKEVLNSQTLGLGLESSTYLTTFNWDGGAKLHPELEVAL